MSFSLNGIYFKCPVYFSLHLLLKMDTPEVDATRFVYVMLLFFLICLIYFLYCSRQNVDILYVKDQMVVSALSETQFLPGSGRIDTAVWMHYLDTD